MANLVDQDISLYHYWRSSCSWRVRWALDLKGVSYQSIPVNILAGEHQSLAYREKSPAGLLPSIEVGGESFSESMAIIEWLDETVPEPPLLPKDPMGRMRVRQLALTIAAMTQPLQNLNVVSYYEPSEARRPEHMRYWITRGLKVYEDLLTLCPKGSFSYGEQLTLADLCLIPQVYNALRFKVDLTPMPRIKGIYEYCRTLPSCERSAPERQPGAAS